MTSVGERAVHGGVKFYRGAARAARNYVEADRSRADDYYLAEGSGVAARLVADVDGNVHTLGAMNGDTYEAWVAGLDPDTGVARGRLRDDDRALRFGEVVINGPKTWSLAAAMNSEIAAAYDAAQDRAAAEIVSWLGRHATTRVGPRGRQVQVPVERLEAAVVRHYTSRAGDPHRHLHLQINARVFAAGKWRGLHSVGVVDSIEAMNGIGHAAVACDPQFRQTLARHGYTLDARTGEITELAPHAPAFAARSAQIGRNIDNYEAAWRREHPGEEPGPAMTRGWDRRAWAQARPDKVAPVDGSQLARRWVDELADLGFTPPTPHAEEQRGAAVGTPIGSLNRDAGVDLILTRLGSRRSAWNSADIRGEAERIIARVDVMADGPVRRELAEDLTARTMAVCRRLVKGDDVPAHVRSLTSTKVLDVEADLVTRIARRAERRGLPAETIDHSSQVMLDESQTRVVAALSGDSQLVVVEGAAGAGKTAALAAANATLENAGRRMIVVTPTLKAAQVASGQIGGMAYSAAWLTHQHGFRWDTDGHRHREAATPDPGASLRPDDLLLVDEAGMLDQDTANALLTIADESGARVALVGDRHQLPAVGRGGVLDHAARWATATTHTLDAVHRFTDPGYAELSLAMRTGHDPGHVFDTLQRQGCIVVHPTSVERTVHLADLGTGGDGRTAVIAGTQQSVDNLNGAISGRRRETAAASRSTGVWMVTMRGDPIGVGDQVATRRNNRDLDVANRDRWIVTAIYDHRLTVHGSRGVRTLPADYALNHLELAYATTAYGAQGDTVDHAHFALDETTGAATAYVAMTRGRHTNTAHLVAEDVDDARQQWITAFSRDRADLGPAHAGRRARDDIDRYGPSAPRPFRSVPRPGYEMHRTSRGPDRSGPDISF